MSHSGWVHLDVKLIVRETDKAFLLRLDDGVEVWAPKSQIDDPEALEIDDRDITVSVTEWWAQQAGVGD